MSLLLEGLAVLGHAADDPPSDLRDTLGFKPRAIAFEIRHLSRPEDRKWIFPASTLAGEK
jgi:hypothetical protein